MELKQKVLKGELAIYCNSRKEAEQVCKEFSVVSKTGYFKEWCYFRLAKNGLMFCLNSFKIKTVSAKKFLALVNNAPQRKIIGYSAPMDLYGGQIKKGDIFMMDTKVSHFAWDEVGNNCLPSEIVETWQPVYEKTEAEKQLEMWDELHEDWCSRATSKFSDYCKKQTKFKLVKI